MTRQQALPDGWRWVTLGEVCGQDRQTVAPFSDLSTTLSYLSLEHIESETGRILQESFGSRQEDVQSNTFAFDNRHVLYGKLRPYLNKVAVPDHAGRCTTELVPLLPSEEISREFLAWTLRRPETVHAVMQGVTGSRMPRAKIRDLFALRIPLPPLEEQQRIVAVLNEKMAAIERARAAAEAQLEAARALPAAYLREVFEGPEAERWPRHPLGNVSSILAGITKGRKLPFGTEVYSVPYLRVANVQDGYLDLSEITYIEATESEIGQYALRRGDLLLTEGGDPDKLGRGTFWEEQIPGCIYQNHVFRVRFDSSQLLPAFVSAQMSSPYGKAYFLARARQTTGIATINRSILANFPLMIPTLFEQKRIVEHLSEHMETSKRLVTSLQEQRDTVNAMPNALLRQAFSGEL